MSLLPNGKFDFSFSFSSDFASRLTNFYNFLKYIDWVGENDMVHIASDLLMSCFRESAMLDSETGASDELREFSLSPATEAAIALSGLLCKFPRFFATKESLSSLSSKSLFR